jgi:hypothetical protein
MGPPLFSRHLGEFDALSKQVKFAKDLKHTTIKFEVQYTQGFDRIN